MSIKRIQRLPFPSQVKSVARTAKSDPTRLIEWVNLIKSRDALKADIKALPKEQAEQFAEIARIFEAITNEKIGDTPSSQFGVNKYSVADRFKILKDLVLVVAQGDSRALIVRGPGGTSKTYTVTKTLDDANIKYAHMCGYTTSLAMYNFIYENRKGIIVIDDCDAALGDPEGLNVLKAVLDTGKRRVQWRSTGTRADTPQFDFDGKIIFITNMPLSRVNASMQALITRTHFLSLDLSKDEIVAMMKTIATTTGHPKLSKKECLAVVRFINDHKHLIRDLNLRLFVHGCNLRAASPKGWKKLFLATLR
jgi:hypothetical protein